MKKYGLYFALLALTAILLFLASCGGGELIDVKDPNTYEYRKIEDSRESLAGNGAETGSGSIQKCSRVPTLEELELLPECEIVFISMFSSSSEEEDPELSSSSSEDGEDPELSSSSSSEEVPSSSSAAPSSSSSAGPTGIPPFTCSWTPSNPQSTGNSKVSVKFDDEEPTVECKKEVFISIFPPTNNLPAFRDTAYLTLDSAYTFPSRIDGIHKINNTPSTSALAMWQRDTIIPANGPFVVQSWVICPRANNLAINDTIQKPCAELYVGTRVSSSSAAPPSSSSAAISSSSATPSSSSAASGGGCGAITDGGGDNPCRCDNRDVYCQWDTGCHAINPRYATPTGQTCSALISACSADGALYVGVTNINEGNNWGEGVTCNGTKLSGSSTTSSSSRASSSSAAQSSSSRASSSSAAQSSSSRASSSSAAQSSSSSSSSSDGGTKNITLPGQNDATALQPGVYNVTAQACTGWGTLIGSNGSGVLTIKVNNTNVTSVNGSGGSSCDGWCSLGSIPSFPFTIEVTSAITLFCRN